MKIVELCGSGHCPVVKLGDERVEIGEKDNIRVLTVSEREVLKHKVLSKELSKLESGNWERGCFTPVPAENFNGYWFQLPDEAWPEGANKEVATMGWLGKLFGSGAQKGATMQMKPLAMKEMTQKEVMKMVKDPVCGMDIDEKSAPAKSEYMGKTYYFCSPGCKKTFDDNPAKYTEGGGHEMSGHGGHTM